MQIQCNAPASGRWADARDDLQRAAQLEADSRNGSGSGGAASTLNNLGNAEGALGEWESARRHYQQVSYLKK